MKLLLDTHVVLWWREDSDRITKAARRTIASADDVLVSAVSGWEVALKLGVGKLKLAHSFRWMVNDSGFAELPVAFAHTEHVATLPRHHGDPFDRMLVAQAQVENATLVTHDRQFKPYDVRVVWV